MLQALFHNVSDEKIEADPAHYFIGFCEINKTKELLKELGLQDARIFTEKPRGNV